MQIFPIIPHDLLPGFVANEHIDWTDATEDLLTTESITGGSFITGGYIGPAANPNLLTLGSTSLILEGNLQTAGMELAYDLGTVTYGKWRDLFLGRNAFIEGYIAVDTISEYTSAAGIDIDGVDLKDGTVTAEHIIISNPTPILVFKDSTYVGDASLGYIEWRDLNNTRLGFFGNSSSGNDDLLWKNESSGGHIGIQTTGEGEVQISANALTVNGTVTATSLTLTAPSTVRVNLTSDQVITTATWTKLEFDVEDWDVKGEFADYKFTPTAAGYYQVNLTVYMIALLNGKMAIARIYKNGDPYSEGRIWTGADGSLTPCVSDMVYLDGDTDYIEGYIYHNNGDDKSAESLAYQTFMSIHRLS